jgi:hypothetical protein
MCLFKPSKLRMNKTKSKFGQASICFTAWLVLCLFGYQANATDSDPRSYSNIPVGMNFLVAGYSHTAGNVAFAPSLPIKNAKINIDSAVLAYSRALDVFGKSGKVDLILPGVSLSGTAEVFGQPREREVGGFADPVARFYVNLYGAPALSIKEFADYEQDIIVGVSFAVSAPGGQYDEEKLVNIGTNRWSFKPEIGISKAWGPVTAELATGAYFFTDNNQPFRSDNQQQDPLFAAQGHLIYNFRPGIWAAFDANYYTGGLITTDGNSADNSLENWRMGGTLSVAVHRNHSIKVFGNTGIYSRTGGNFDTVGIAWMYRWGDGY